MRLWLLVGAAMLVAIALGDACASTAGRLKPLQPGAWRADGRTR